MSETLSAVTATPTSNSVPVNTRPPPAARRDGEHQQRVGGRARERRRSAAP